VIRFVAIGLGFMRGGVKLWQARIAITSSRSATAAQMQMIICKVFVIHATAARQHNKICREWGIKSLQSQCYRPLRQSCAHVREIGQKILVKKMRGRKPKPTELKKRSGNPGKRKLNDREPKPKATTDGTKVDRLVKLANKATGVAFAAAQKMFIERYAPQLGDLGVLTDADVAAFEMMSTHYGLVKVAEAVIEHEGLLTMTVMDGVKRHPLLQTIRENSTAFRLYAAEFGMTPAGRARLSIEEKDDDDDLAKLLFGQVTPQKHE
jgi:P27 family predicted phage terminase small subunit